MNWSLIEWVFGTMMTFYGIKFVLRLLHQLFSRDTMDSAIGAIGNSCTQSADNLTNYLAGKIKARRAKKEAEEPFITIR